MLLRHAERPGDGDDRRLQLLRRLQRDGDGLRELEPDWIVNELEESGLRGRGGAGFSMGKKVSFLPRGEMPKYLCCNADESEPGAFKDRELMQRNPHQLIEGIVIAAFAAGVGHAFIFIRGEYDRQADILDEAVEEAYEAGYLGDGHPRLRLQPRTGRPPRRRRLHLRRGDGAARRARGQARKPAAEAALPRGRGPLRRADPDQQRRDPLATCSHIVANGADWFKSFGTEQSPGTKVVSVSGCVQRPGNYEVELGVPTREIDLRAGRRPARRPRDQGLLPRRILLARC